MMTIYHNPDCGTSRNTLAMIRAAGIEPTVILYLKTPPTRDEIKRLVALTGGSLRALIREKESVFRELALDRQDITDDLLLDAIERHPVLLNRPIVISEKGAALCRPSERVIELLPHGLAHEFIKEDGERVAATSS